MKGKIKSKALDAVAAFFGSFLALYIFNIITPTLNSFFVYMKWETSSVEKAEDFILAFLIAIGFISVLLIFWLITTLFSNFKSPEIRVTFLDQRNKHIQELDFRDESQEPQYLKISFSAKFSRVQLWFLQKVLKARLIISLNPKMCSIELAEGFIADNEDFQLENQSVYFDIFSKYSPSDEPKSIYAELSLLLVHSAEGEIKIMLDLSQSFGLYKYIFVDYCKFNIEKFSTQG